MLAAQCWLLRQAIGGWGAVHRFWGGSRGWAVLAGVISELMEPAVWQGHAHELQRVIRLKCEGVCCNPKH